MWERGWGGAQAVRISLSLCPGPPRRPPSPEGVFVHQVVSQRDSGWGLDHAGPAWPPGGLDTVVGHPSAPDRPPGNTLPTEGRGQQELCV